MNNTNNTTKRPYKAFPYVEVLTALMAGDGYDATAKKFGYYEADKQDSTKSFRAHLHRARHTGFAHEGKTIKFPAFNREGKPVFGKGRPNGFIVSLMQKNTNDKPVKAVKADSKPITASAKPNTVVNTKTTDTQMGIKLVSSSTRGRRPNNAVVMVVDKTGNFLTLSVPKTSSLIPLDEFMKVMKQLEADIAINAPKVDEVPQQVEENIPSQPVVEAKQEDIYVPEIRDEDDVELDKTNLALELASV